MLQQSLQISLALTVVLKVTPKAVAILSDAFCKNSAVFLFRRSISAVIMRRRSSRAIIWLVLIDVAQRCYESAGIEPELAKRLAEPLASKTLENCFRLGTTAALTGPIKRGDMDIVALQLQGLAVLGCRLRICMKR